MPPMLSSATIVENSFAFDPMHIWTAQWAQKMRTPVHRAPANDLHVRPSQIIFDRRLFSTVLADRVG